MDEKELLDNLDGMEIPQNAKDKIRKMLKKKQEKKEQEVDRKELAEMIAKELKEILPDGKKLLDAIKEIEVKAPEVNISDIKVPEVKIPDFKLPEINIPKIETPKIPDINIPEIKIPEIKVPEIKIPKQEIIMPSEMEVKGIGSYFKSVNDSIKSIIKNKFSVVLHGGINNTGSVERDNPIPVIPVDQDGKVIKGGGVNIGGGRVGGIVGVKDKDDVQQNPATEDKQDDIIDYLNSVIDYEYEPTDKGILIHGEDDYHEHRPIRVDHYGHPQVDVTTLPDVIVSKNKGTMSTNNSTTTPLGIDGVFTGVADDIKDFAAINISVFADQASAACGFSIEWSQDGTNWDEKMTVAIGASKVESYEFGVRARYFRVVYTNGGTAQGAFRIQVIYHPVRTREGARCLCVDIDPREFAKSVRAVLAAKKPNGVYTNIHSTAGGNLKMAIEESELDFPIGTGSNGSVTLTSANTAYAIPATASTKNHIIILYNGSDTDMFVGYQDSNSDGILLATGKTREFNLGISQQVYAYCASASKVLTYSYKELNN